MRNVHVNKPFNTMSAFVRLNPERVAGGDSTVFMSGNDLGGKDILQFFGWRDIIALCDVLSSLAVEMQMPIWLKAWGVLGQTHLNFKIIRQIQI